MASVCRICSSLNWLWNMPHEWSRCGTTGSFWKLFGWHTKLSSWRLCPTACAHKLLVSFTQASNNLNVKSDTLMRKKRVAKIHFGQHGSYHSVSRPPTEKSEVNTMFASQVEVSGIIWNVNVSACWRYFCPSVKREEFNDAIDFAQSGLLIKVNCWVTNDFWFKISVFQHDNRAFDHQWIAKSVDWVYKWSRLSTISMLLAIRQTRDVEWCNRFCSKWTFGQGQILSQLIAFEHDRHDFDHHEEFTHAIDLLTVTFQLRSSFESAFARTCEWFLIWICVSV